MKLKKKERNCCVAHGIDDELTSPYTQSESKMVEDVKKEKYIAFKSTEIVGVRLRLFKIELTQIEYQLLSFAKFCLSFMYHL